MNAIHHPQLNETLYREVLPNGLTVCVVPKPGFTKKCAYFATNYGSIHTSYALDGVSHTSPDGVAHYLEHKMFDMPGDRDIMAEFAALGANPNAFTAYFMTAYYFTCTDHFRESLELLLRFVSTPYFTGESVDKERGIIAQEILMYDDSADSRVYENLFRAMYRHHPVKSPIAGTVESIEDITAETLYQCYDAFYRPSNMILCVVGDVDPGEVERLALEVLPEISGAPAVPDFGPAESMVCRGQDVSDRMDVAMPTFQMGFKCPWISDGQAAVRQQIIGDLAADVLASESSALFMRLYQAGLIDGSFACGYEDMPGAALLSCGGDSKDPEAVRAAVIEEAQRLAREGVDEGLFRRLKKSALGRRYKALDSFDSLCFRICAAHFDGTGYLDFPQVYASVTSEEIRAFLENHITWDNCAMSVILPREKEDNPC